MMDRNGLHGIFIPVVTPFGSDGELDQSSYANYVTNLLSHPIHGVVINGTTGESPTVRWEEMEVLIRITRDLLDGLHRKMPVIVGTGTNDTASTVDRTKKAAQAGADAVLVVIPYYSKPSQEGIFKHFQQVAQVGIPVVVYEIPARTGVRLNIDTAKRIMELDNVIGIKDSSDQLELVSALSHVGVPVLCGDDLHFHDKLSLGASGGILASANINTERFIEVYAWARQGDLIKAKEAFDSLVPWIQKLFQESNPAPLKWLLKRQGFISSDHLRLPMSPISVELEDELEQLQSL